MTRRIISTCFVVAMAVAAKPAAAQDVFQVNDKLAQTGKKVFMAKGCNGCHTIGKGDLAAPDLGGLLQRRSQEWIRKWLHDPTPMLLSDDTAKALMKRYNGMRMPELGLSDKMIDALMNYIAQETIAAKRSTPAATQ
ncbi:MAG TPA: cytochrome c [Longimicrobiales bacterium]|nr:cytochrome c [Longimicrobiales bacterium]